MGDPLKKVQPGDPLRIPAQTFNVFVDAAEDFLRRRRASAPGTVPVPDFRQAGIVAVKNSSGGDRQRFDVLGIYGPLFDPSVALESFKNRMALSGVTPDADYHTGRFCILLEPLAANAIGLAVLSGVCPAKLTVNDEDDRFADIIDGDAGGLESGTSGSAEILWKQGGTGSGKWALVRLGPTTAPVLPARFINFILSEDLGVGDVSASATVEHYWDGDDPDPESAGITVWNKTTHTAGTYMFHGDQNDRGMAVYDERDGKYRIWQMEC